LTDIPPEIRDIIVQHFDSPEAVDIVLLLRRSRNAFWSPAAVSQHLGIREDIAARQLAAMARSCILVEAEQNRAFRYEPSDSCTESRIDELAEIYANRRMSVINAIYSANLDKLRAFSNAFRLDKK
jgi:AraC-like DNA-binding protein